MSVTISSSALTCRINKQGAELSSVKNSEGTEFIWQANKEIWARHAPVLFPTVGKLKDNTFIFENKKYELPQHGFARDMKFTLVHLTESVCTFQLVSNEETLKKYPFNFILEITYEVKDNKLITTYNVTNSSDSLLYFAIGAHPGFNVPLEKGERFEDYYLEFEPSSSYNTTVLKDGLLTEFKKELKLEGNRLNLTSALFDNDALVFEDHQINTISLGSFISNHKIKMECSHWPYFGIWSKKGSREFVCLEPWYGITDRSNSDKQFVNKKGLLLLDPDKDFTCSFSVTFI